MNDNKDAATAEKDAGQQSAEKDAVRSEALADALCRWNDEESYAGQPCAACMAQAEALSPLVAGWLAQAWDEGLAVGMDDDRCTNEENSYRVFPPGQGE